MSIDSFDIYVYYIDNHQLKDELAFTTAGKSLICKRKCKRTRTVPCGTSESTLANKDDLAFTITTYLRPGDPFICVNVKSVQAY